MLKGASRIVRSGAEPLTMNLLRKVTSCQAWVTQATSLLEPKCSRKFLSSNSSFLVFFPNFKDQSYLFQPVDTRKIVITSCPFKQPAIRFGRKVMKSCIRLFMKKIVFSLALISLIQFAKGQDPAFSQFFASPLTLNPALTGKFNGSVRVAGNYRNQWPQINNAYITSTVSVDGNILTNRITNGDAWGVGLMAMTDKTADGILTSNYVAISTSYQKALD